MKGTPREIGPRDAVVLRYRLKPLAGGVSKPRDASHRRRATPRALARLLRSPHNAGMADTLPQVPSLWWTQAGPSHPPLSADIEADVAIVGGGIAGATLAWTLVEQGATVVLLEAGRLACEASGRNAGFLLAIPAEPYAERIAIWGREGARAYLQLGRRTQQRIAHLAQVLRIECDHRITGSVRLTRSEEETEDLRGSLPELRHDGFPMREVALADVLPAPARGKFHAA